MASGTLTGYPTGQFAIAASNFADPLVTIAPDGTVTVHKEGTAPAAAELFWGAVRNQGQTFTQALDVALYAAVNAERALEDARLEEYGEDFGNDEYYEDQVLDRLVDR